MSDLLLIYLIKTSTKTKLFKTLNDYMKKAYFSLLFSLKFRFGMLVHFVVTKLNRVFRTPENLLKNLLKHQVAN